MAMRMAKDRIYGFGLDMTVPAEAAVKALDDDADMYSLIIADLVKTTEGVSPEAIAKLEKHIRAGKNLHLEAIFSV